MLPRKFYKDNRKIPLGFMLLTTTLFLYYLSLHKETVSNFDIPSEQHYSRTDDSSATDGLLQALQEQQKIQTEEHYAESDHQPGVPSHQPSHSSSPPAYTAPNPDYGSQGALKTSEVALLLKTGASLVWKRLPIHLLTSLAPERIAAENTIIYSDVPDVIGSYQLVDVLANTSSRTVLRSPDFQPYLLQEDFDEKQGWIEGDIAGPIGGWKLDKYKFLPLINHAGQSQPDAKWYIYMEDDAFIFLPNLLQHLATFDWKDAWYIGSLAVKHGEIFAHGGAGFALSRGAWEKTFGTDKDIIEKYENFTEAHGCGDHVLGHVLKDHGVSFGETHEAEQFTFGFNPESYWNMWYGKANWCKPIFSMHHMHLKDISRSYNVEKAWDFAKNGLMRYRDIYHSFIAPVTRRRIEWWDNRSSSHAISSSEAKAGENMWIPESVNPRDSWLKSWESVDDCEEACLAWPECVQWSFYEDLCKMSDRVVLGTGYTSTDPRRLTALKTTSGWVSKRVEEWACGN
uniref:N-acetylgalactosaminide beta-1,3-galactosyltransferase n=1 Tax=Talaromyces marneffei PM1 TaxID=1077442 RepID=A0A093V617_TALMA